MAQRSIVNRYELLVIGGSAGSLDALLQLLPALKSETWLAIVLVLHRKSGESLLVDLLGDKLDWTIKEAEEKESIIAGTVYIAPADYHLLIEKDKTFSLDYSEKVNYSRPAIDVTFETAAEAYGASVIALLLSGASQDGTEGLRKIGGSGGYVMVQDPAEALVGYMPQHAIQNTTVDEVVAVLAVPASIRRLFLA